MFTKPVALLCLLAALNVVKSSPASPTKSIVAPSNLPPNPWVFELCGKTDDPPACEKVARKCQYSPPPGGQETFCTCKNSVAGVSALYSTWVATENEGVDICSATFKPADAPALSAKEGKKHVSFNEYLTKTDATLDANLECCVAKARGLFDDSNSAILTAWKANTELIEDPAAKAAMIASLTSCQATSKTCNYYSFMSCAMKGCYETIKPPAP